MPGSSTLLIVMSRNIIAKRRRGGGNNRGDGKKEERGDGQAARGKIRIKKYMVYIYKWRYSYINMLWGLS